MCRVYIGVVFFFYFNFEEVVRKEVGEGSGYFIGVIRARVVGRGLFV